MFNLFGRSRKSSHGASSSAPPPEAAISKLRTTITRIEKREELLLRKINAEVAKARTLAKTNKRAALQCLRRKKMFEQQLDRLGAARANLEEQIFSLESSSLTVSVVEAMQAGTHSLRSAHERVSIDRVEDIVDDMREQQDMADDIGRVLGEPLGRDVVDTDELEGELAELTLGTEQAEAPAPRVSAPSEDSQLEALLAAPAPPTSASQQKAPAASTASRPAANPGLTQDEDDELERLLAE